MRGSLILFVFIPLLAAGISWGGGGMLFPTAQTTYSWPLRLGGRVGLNWLESEDASAHLFSASSVSVEVARIGVGFGVGNRYQAMYFLPLFGGGSPSRECTPGKAPTQPASGWRRPCPRSS